MRRTLNLRTQFFLMLALACACLITKHLIEHRAALRPNQTISLDPVQASYEARSLKRFNLGFQNLISGLSWIQLLQNSTHDPIHDEKVSWEYAKLDAITHLDPNFTRAYSFGAIFLSVFKRDKLGAKLLLENWVKYRPNSWNAHLMFGFHLYNEMGDTQRGSREILAAAHLPGAPEYLSALGVRLFSESGSLVHALRLSLDLYEDLPSEEGRKRLQMRVRSLNFALQKSAWERALDRYRAQKHHEPASTEELQPLTVSELRELASTVEVPPDLVPLLKQIHAFRYDPQTKKIESVKTLAQLKIEPVGTHVHDDEKKEKASGQ